MGQIHTRRPEIQTLLKRFNNFCYLKTSFDLKMQDIVQTRRDKETTKNVEQNFVKSQFRDLEIIESIQ